MSKLRYASILMSLLTLLAGCGVCDSYNGIIAGFLGQPTPVPNSDDLLGFSVSRPVIESPLNNSELPLLPFVVSTYAGHPAGAVQAVLLVNGQEVRTDPVVPVPDPKHPGSFLMTKIDQTWTPPQPGAYYLQVRVTWSGDAGKEITYPVLVYVGGVPTLDFTQVVKGITATAAVLTGTPKPTGLPSATLPASATASPTLGPSATKPRLTFTPSATTRPTTPAPTFTNTAPPSPTITTTAGVPFLNFTSDSTSLTAGQCTNLHWSSGNIQSIFLNGQGTVGSLDVQVCPPNTITYTLVAHTTSGDITKQITITVAGPTATNTATTAAATATNTAVAGGPDITGHSTSTNIFDNFADCAVSHPHSVTFTVNVTGATQVQLSYQVQGSGSAGTLAMNPNGGDSWSATLTGDTGALPGLPVGTLLYSFTASNGSGNASSPTFSDVTYNDCSS